MAKFYITTSIPYINAEPHIGFALEAVQADVIARYNRLLKKDVFFLTGTDEHGLKALKAAQEKNKAPKAFVDEMAEKFKELKQVLNLSNDDFIRTTDEKRHKPAVEKFWKELAKRGDIYKKKYKGLYCFGCEAFLFESDLEGGKCPYHKKKPELVEEENYFFKLSKYLPKIKKIIEKEEIKIIPESRKNEILKIIESGLDDISFSRAKEKYWGFSVPGDENQVIYVWGDALINYISALGYFNNSKKFRKYWPADIHCIGKDIIKFHAIFWPAMLLSVGLALPKKIFVHGFISAEGKKMSKSLGNVIKPSELVKKYGRDPVRYYLLSEISPIEDGDFSYQKFESRYNSDLAGGIGNLVSRTCSLGEKIGAENKNNKNISQEIAKAKKRYETALDKFKFNEALKSIWDLIGFCDKYIDKEKPWQNRHNSRLVVGNVLLVLDNIADLLKPFLPETAEKILKEIRRDKKGFLKNKKGKSLFPRI